MRKEEEGFRLGPSVPESGTAGNTGSRFVFAVQKSHQQKNKTEILVEWFIQIQWKCSAAQQQDIHGTLLSEENNQNPVLMEKNLLPAWTGS
jgi:hypothetical protein